MNRLVISGVSGGGGKTLLALGLARALVRLGLRVKPFKKGPDYIDAMWLAKACGHTCTNLDPYFLSAERLQSLFVHAMDGADMGLIEGNRGLYDGSDVQGSCSTAALARVLDAPVVLSLNCTKMTRTAAALLAGLTQFESLRFGGVVLNRIGTARQEQLIRQSIETYTDIPVLGALPRLKDNPLPERHMGLVASNDDNTVLQVLDTLGTFITEHVDMNRIQQLVINAEFPSVVPFWQERVQAVKPVRIGYVCDRVLWFYYEENLEALRRAGAELVCLDLFDTKPWPQLDGIYIGGGFPELYAANLAQAPGLSALRTFSEANLPIYAECGGMMLLCEALHVDGVRYPMAGILPAESFLCAKPQGLGYVDAVVEQENPFYPRGTRLRGHEFHYSYCVPRAEAALILRLERGVGMGHRQQGVQKQECRDGLLIRNTFASYLHVFAPAAELWAERFVEACSKKML